MAASFSIASQNLLIFRSIFELLHNRRLKAKQIEIKRDEEPNKFRTDKDRINIRNKVSFSYIPLPKKDSR